MHQSPQRVNGARRFNAGNGEGPHRARRVSDGILAAFRALKDTAELSLPLCGRENYAHPSDNGAFVQERESASLNRSTSRLGSIRTIFTLSRTPGSYLALVGK